MKQLKWLLPLLIILAIGAGYWYLTLPPFQDRQITQMNIYRLQDGRHTETLYKDSDTYTFLLGALNRAEQFEVTTDPEATHQLSISHKKDAPDHYRISMRTDAMQAVVFEEHGTTGYRLLSSDAVQLMTLSGVEDIYPARNMPEAWIGETQDKPEASSLLLPVSSDWKYQKADDAWYAVLPPTSPAGQTPDFALQEDAFTPLRFSTTPDEVIIEVYDSKLLLDRAVITSEPETIIRTVHDKPWTLRAEHSEEGITKLLVGSYPLEAPLTYRIIANWSEGRDDNAYGTMEWQYTARTNLLPVLSLNRSTAHAGDYFALTLANVSDDEMIELTHPFGPDAPWWTVGHKKMAFIPLNYWTKKGTYDISVTVKSPVAPLQTLTQRVHIEDRDFNIQRLYVDEKTDSSTRNSDAYAQYAEYFGPIRDQSSSEALWDGAFIQPCEGRISTDYGEMRYVNDALTSYRHSGIDIAAPKGTPVLATNRGEVKLSMHLTLTGNTVVIDHGLGFFSIYFHMDSLNAEAGEIVEKGETIGTVGSTGFSTGPHLHWTMSNFKINVDPNTMMESEPIAP